MDVKIAAVSDAELAEFMRVSEVGFGSFPRPDAIELERSVLPVDRTVAAYDGADIVATAASYPFELTLPGGTQVPVAGVTAVSVSPTHRRRGILRQMMHFQLDDVAARGEPLAILNASEATIYGRFGYGVASLFQELEVNTARAGFRRLLPDRPPLRLVPKEHAIPVIAPIYDRYRQEVPGSLSRSVAWWKIMLGDVEQWKGGGKLFVVVAEPYDGDAGGFAVYKVVQSGPTGTWRVEVRELVAVEPHVEATLWRFLFDIDLVATVLVQTRPLDDPLRFWLADLRALQVRRVLDYLWVRILDVSAALESRRYPVPGELVLEVDDPFRPAVSGRYRVAGGPDGASCERTEHDPDLSLGIEELGSLYLGGVLARELAHAGRIREHTPGALGRMSAMFAAARQPHCTTRF
jgi:predicted acetyltransferase